MKRKYIITLICILIINFCIISNQNPKYIKTIITGVNEGEIKWIDDKGLGGLSPGASSFCVGEDNKIYISDRYNKRINIYDLNINYINSITENSTKKLSHFAIKMYVDKNGNILTYSGNLHKIDNNGNFLFTIKCEKLPDEITGLYNFFPLSDKILYYNDNNNIDYLNAEGTKLRNTSAKDILKSLNTEYENQLKTRGERNTLNDLSADKQKIVRELREDGKHIIIGDNFYSSSFYAHKKYYEKLKGHKLDVVRSTGTRNNIEVDLDDYSFIFIGYDNDHNSYWTTEEEKEDKNGIRNFAIAIFSKHGDLLDAFNYGQLKKSEWITNKYPTSGAKTAIAPNGDVYFMKGSKEGHSFYKVERQW